MGFLGAIKKAVGKVQKVAATVARNPVVRAVNPAIAVAAKSVAQPGRALQVASSAFGGPAGAAGRLLPANVTGGLQSIGNTLATHIKTPGIMENLGPSLGFTVGGFDFKLPDFSGKPSTPIPRYDPPPAVAAVLNEAARMIPGVRAAEKIINVAKTTRKGTTVGYLGDSPPLMPSHTTGATVSRLPTATAPRRKYRRMNPLNPKALNRSIRRARAFEKFARRTIALNVNRKFKRRKRR